MFIGVAETLQFPCIDPSYPSQNCSRQFSPGMANILIEHDDLRAEPLQHVGRLLRDKVYILANLQSGSFNTGNQRNGRAATAADNAVGSV